MASANIFQQYLQAPRSVLDYQQQYEEADARKAALKRELAPLVAIVERL